MLGFCFDGSKDLKSSTLTKVSNEVGRDRHKEKM